MIKKNADRKKIVNTSTVAPSTVAASTLADVSQRKLIIKENYLEKKLMLMERQTVALKMLANVLKNSFGTT